MLTFTIFALSSFLVSGQTSSDPFAGYNCPSSCQPPNCRCASKSPPIANPPQFILVTFDDGVNSNIMPTALSLFSGRKNPKGCMPQGTFYAQATYTDPYLLTQWYATGHEVADHSFTHGQPVNPAVDPSPFTGNRSEIVGTWNWFLNYAGIPAGKVAGVRFPFRNYTAQSLANLAAWGYQYDSSMSVNAGAESIWPYTLDYGVVSECTGRQNLPTLCGKGPINANGLWEIPMYQTVGTEGVHLMDPYNDNSMTGAQTTAMLLSNFQQHYSGTRAPFGIYTHPTWMTAGIAGIPDGAPKLKSIQDFLDKAMANPDVWMVTGAQLIQYMKNPVSAANLGSQSYMQCKYKPAPNICNGGPSSTGVQSCSQIGTVFNTCYNCPSVAPTVQNPVPSPSSTTRCTIPRTCDMIYWDPIGCKCLCTGADCSAYMDKPIAAIVDPNGSSGSGSGSGSGTSGSKNSGLTKSASLASSLSALIISLIW